ncbi:MAG TPA: ferrochelatase [Saprospiraceae bacterium]|nr:ferrochelatase [Saprospiraceae bacterium]
MKKNHMLAGKKGILLVNLGTPDDPGRSSVYRYLKQFLLDRRVIDLPWLLGQLLGRLVIVPFRSGSSAKLYQRLWTKEGSPIKIYGMSVARKLQQHLGDNYAVELAMRYQSPDLETALKKLIFEIKVSEIVVFPMFPQYASATTGSVHDEVMRLLRQWDLIPNVKMINSYPDNPEMIDVFVQNAKKYEVTSYDHFIFSFHGVPERHVKKADPSGSHCLKKENCCNLACLENQFCYSAQCHTTAHAIATKLGLDKEQYSITYQSRLGKDPWLQPYTDQTLQNQLSKGNKKILVFSPAFVADCLETTIEIGFEYKEDFIHNGGERLDLVESLNDNEAWVKAIANMVK